MLALWEESYDEPKQVVLKSKDITLPTKVRLVKAMFPVVTYGCESWTIKEALFYDSPSRSATLESSREAMSNKP